MLQRLREHLVLALIAILPFHAFLVTVGTRMMEGPGHAPLTELAMWKEAVLGVVLVIAPFEKLRISKWFDVFDWLIISLVLLSFILFAYGLPLTASGFLFGFKYDFIPLIAFLILRRVEWSQVFFDRVMKVILVVGAIVAGYGIISFFLPQSFFVWLGYSDLHSLYVPEGPLAAYQQIGDTGIRRIQSVMSGPNQLGIWLLVPWSVALVASHRKVFSIKYLVLSIVGVALVLTFSRSAWVAAGVIVLVLMWMKLPHDKFFKAAGLLVLLGVVNLGLLMMLAPDLVMRAASTRDHLIKPLQAMDTIAENPWGLGLGTAGPASNRVSDACVHLPEGSDATWAADRPNLCVFVGNDQVQPSLKLRPTGQPVDRVCKCPMLPENWYLQIGVELGRLGFMIYILLVLLLIRRLIFNFQFSIFNSCACLMFLGVSAAALFLHAWEDAAVAYSVWILIATNLRSS